METIPIKAVIASYFAQNPKKKEITFENLSELKSNLEKKFQEKHSLTKVEYYRSDLINLAKRHPESFEVDFNSNKVKRINDKADWYMLGSIPHKIKADYFKFFSKINFLPN